MESITVQLTPENESFEGARTVTLTQPVTIGRQLENQDQQSANYVRFNSKVVSRQHCKLSYSDGKFYIQDTKSSSGTFVNGDRLSAQGASSQPRALRDGDLIKLGEDFQADNLSHKAIQFKVKLPAGAMVVSPGAEGMDEDSYVDTAMDGDVRASVDDEFNTIWNSLVADINAPLKRLRSAQAAAAAATPTATKTGNGTGSNTSATLSAKPDTTITLIKKTPTNESKTVANTPTPAANTPSPAKPANGGPDPEVRDCIAFIQSLTWETKELKDTLLDLAKHEDQQLIAFYRSLKGFPGSFTNVASKYVKVSKGKK